MSGTDSASRSKRAGGLTPKTRDWPVIYQPITGNAFIHHRSFEAIRRF
jgi:hypothetical protein